MAEILERPALASTSGYIQWGPVIAGAVSAAALATVLHAFAAAIGLAVSSTAPTWRDALVAAVPPDAFDWTSLSRVEDTG